MNHEDILVSIIVPVYNAEKYVSKCIESILAQTHKNLELILVDDGSSDKSGEICDSYAATDSRVKVIHNKNGGPSAARNTGLDVAAGDYLTFVDSDDFLNIHTLELTVANCIENDCEICIYNFHTTKDHSIAYDTPVSNNHKVYDTDYLLKNYDKFPQILYSCSSCDKLFKSEIFNTLRFPIGIDSGEDASIRFHTLFQSNKICLMNVGLYYCFLSPNSIMRSPFKERALGVLKASQINLEFLKDKNYPNITKNIEARYEYDICRLYAQLCLSSLKNKKELKAQLKADRKQIHENNKNNPHLTKSLRWFATLIYYFPPVYLLKGFLVHLNNIVKS